MCFLDPFLAIYLHVSTKASSFKCSYVSVSRNVACVSVMGGLKWKSNVLMTALFVPGYVLLLTSLDIGMTLLYVMLFLC